MSFAGGMVWQIRAAFLFGVAAFVLPMTVCAAGVLQGKINFFDNSRQNMEAENVVMLEENVPVIQEFTADGYTLSGIKIRIYTEPGNSEINSLNVVLKEKDTGKVIYEKNGDTYGMKENTALYPFLKEKNLCRAGKNLSSGNFRDAPKGSGKGLYCVTDKKGTELRKILLKTEVFRCVFPGCSKKQSL